jgi:hypothetical protein
MLAFVIVPKSTIAEKTDVDIYLYDPCGKCLGAVGYGGCGECKLSEEIAGRLNKILPPAEYAVNYLNLRFDTAFGEERDDRLETLGLSPKDIDLPTLFIGNAVFLADGTQDAEIRKYVVSGLTDYPGYDLVLEQAKERAERTEANRVVYIYSPYCESCAGISEWLETALPEGYELVKYDLTTQLGLLMEQHAREAFSIAEDDFYVPFIMYGDYDFMGSDAIQRDLPVILSALPDQETYVIREEDADGTQP